MLSFPERFVQESPVRAVPPAQMAVTQKVDKRTVFVDGGHKAEDPEDAPGPKRKWDVQAHPHRITKVKFGPVEVNSSLPFTLDEEAIGCAFRPHVVLKRAAGQRQGMPMKERPM